MADVKLTLTADDKGATKGLNELDRAIDNTTAGAKALGTALESVQTKGSSAMRIAGNGAKRSGQEMRAAARDVASSMNMITSAVTRTITSHGSRTRAQIAREIMSGLSVSDFDNVARVGNQSRAVQAKRSAAQSQQQALRSSILSDPSGASATAYADQGATYRGRTGDRAARQLKALKAYAGRMGLDRTDDVDLAIARQLFLVEKRTLREAKRTVGSFGSAGEYQAAVAAGVDVTRPSLVAKFRNDNAQNVARAQQAKTVAAWDADIDHNSFFGSVNPPPGGPPIPPTDPPKTWQPRGDRGLQRTLDGMNREESDRAAIDRNAQQHADRVQRTALADRAERERVALNRSNRMAQRRAIVRRRRGELFSGGAQVGGTVAAGLYAGSRIAESVEGDATEFADAAGSFERDMRPLVGIENNVDRQQQLRRQVIAMAASSGTSTGEAAGTMYGFLSDASAFSPEMQKGLLRTGSALTRVTDSSAAENLQALIKVMNVYGGAVGGLDTAASKLMRTTEVGSVTMKQLGTRLPDLLPAFKAGGFSLDEALSAIAVGTNVGGRPEDTFTDIRNIAAYMPKAYAAKLATPGKSFAENLREIAAAKPSSSQLMSVFGIDSLSTVQMMTGRAAQIEKVTSNIAATRPQSLREKVAAYEADPTTSLGQRSQRLDAMAGALRSGMITSGAAGDRAVEGVRAKAVDVGYDLVMDSTSKGVQDATMMKPLSKLLYRGLFESAGSDLLADQGFEQARATGDRGDYDRAVRDRIAGGAFLVADSSITSNDWGRLDSKGNKVEARWWGKDPGGAYYRRTNQADADAWATMRKERDWADMPFNVFTQFNDLKETGNGDPEAYLQMMLARRAKATAAGGGGGIGARVGAGLTTGVGVAATMIGTLARRGLHGAIFDATRTKGQRSALLDAENDAFITGRIKGFEGDRDAAKAAGDMGAEEDAIGMLGAIRARKYELTRDDGKFGFRDRQKLAGELGKKDAGGPPTEDEIAAGAGKAGASGGAGADPGPLERLLTVLNKIAENTAGNKQLGPMNPAQNNSSLPPLAKLAPLPLAGAPANP